MENNKKLAIRSATVHDIDFVVPLVSESSGGVWPVIWRAVKTDSETELAAAIKYMSDRGNKLSVENTFIAEMEDKSLAVMIAYNERQNHPSTSKKYELPQPLVTALTPYTELTDLDSLFISELCTTTDARGHGIGTRMLDHAKVVAKAHGYEAVTLRVFSENPQAIKLYERFGFTRVDSRPVLPYPGISVEGEVWLMRYCL